MATDCLPESRMVVTIDKDDHQKSLDLFVQSLCSVSYNLSKGDANAEYFSVRHLVIVWSSDHMEQK